MEELLKALATEIDKMYRPYSWYQCVGRAKDHLIIYTKKVAPAQLQMKMYKTVPVVFKNIGQIRPIP